MRTRLVQLAAVSAADVAAWRDLAGRAAEPNPFFEPDFVLAARAALGQKVMLLVTESDERWLGCLPVRRFGLTGMLRAWQHPYCFLGTPLLDAGSPRAAAVALLSSTRLLILHAQHTDGPVAAALAAAAGERGLRPFYEVRRERAALVRRSEPTYLDGMKAHRRREFRRQMRRLEEELATPAEVRDVSADPNAPDRFMALEAAGWKGRSGTALGSTPSHAEFFRTICTAFGARSRLQMLELAAGERTVAMKCNLLAGDGVFCFKIAHDEELSAFSPGVQLELANVERFHSDCTELWADSCADPDNDMINRLWPDRRPIVSYAVARGKLNAALLGRAAAALNDMRSRERTAPSPAS